MPSHLGHFSKSRRLAPEEGARVLSLGRGARTLSAIAQPFAALGGAFISIVFRGCHNPVTKRRIARKSRYTSLYAVISKTAAL